MDESKRSSKQATILSHRELLFCYIAMNIIEEGSWNKFEQIVMDQTGIPVKEEEIETLYDKLVSCI